MQFGQHDNFAAQMYIMTKEEGGLGQPLTDGKAIMCFSKTWDCSAFTNLVGKEMVMPGEDTPVNMQLLKPMVLASGQQFTIRLGNATIGTGKVTEVKANLSKEEREMLTMTEF